MTDYGFKNEKGTNIFWKLQLILVELYNHYWLWNKNSEEVAYKFRERERKTRDGPRSKPDKKEESFYEEIGTDPENSKRIAYEGRV